MICAWLEDAGYRLPQIKDLTRGYVSRVLGWPRDKHGVLRRPPPRDGRPAPTDEDRARAYYFERGIPPHRMEEKVREWRQWRDRQIAEQEREPDDGSDEADHF